MSLIMTQHLQHGPTYQSPPSPPTERGVKLPSIHAMFNLAGEGSPTSETAPQRSPLESSFHDSTSSQKSQSRPTSSYSRTDMPPRYAITQQSLPPTPPMSSDVTFTASRPHSPIHTLRRESSKPPQNYYQEPTPEREDHLRRPVPHAPAPQHYAAPTPAPVYHQAPPPPQIYHSMQYQRPLPQNFVPPQHYAPHPAPGQWQPTAHHHYLNPSQGPTYAQTQDRYICQQCGKAFSRPSSLRIHTHSHTGEKPFKCTKPHCNKAFSVRSNMKRHEKGCNHHDLILKGR